jgi:hypothetical protein
MDSAEEYLKAANGMRSWNGPAIRLVSPGNRPRYRQQVQAGFGFYLDMFLNPEGHQYYRPPLNGSRLARLERNLAFARDAADQYVWIYGEQCRWWGKPLNLPKTAGKGRLWEEALPGTSFAIAFASDPVSAARDVINARRQSSTLTNLAQNPKFSEAGPAKPNPLPAGFSSWQHEKEPPGTFRWDPSVGDGSGRANNVKWGCLIQGHPVTPGQTYAVAADCRVQGNSHPTLVVRWQTPQQRWTHEGDDRTFAFNKTAGQWDKAFGVITVPEGVGQLIVLLNVTGQATQNDVCWFDNLELHRIR